MVNRLQVTFRNLEHSDAIEAAVRERAEKLDNFHPRIMSCRVVVEASHHRPRTAGTVYQVRVDVTLPHGEVFAHREPPLERFHEDVYVAIRDAFDQARRELEDHVRKQRGDVKTHEERSEEWLAGRISKIFPDRGYGFIEKAGSDDVYFHKNSVKDHEFDHLSVGAEVQYEEEEGEHGPQASTVILAKAS